MKPLALGNAVKALAKQKQSKGTGATHGSLSSFITPAGTHVSAVRPDMGGKVPAI